MIDEILNAYGARFVIAASGVFLALVVLVIVLWIIRNKAPAPFVRGGRSRQPRLQVLDAAAVDTRRRLVLVRRDNIEHLILIGGPTDIVIESGIGEPKTYLAGELAAETALQQRDDTEARLPRQETAALQTPTAALPAEEPAPRPVANPVSRPAVAARQEARREASVPDLIMPAEAPAAPIRPEPIMPERPARVEPRPAPAPVPETAAEPARSPRPQPAAPTATATPPARPMAPVQRPRLLQPSPQHLPSLPRLKRLKLWWLRPPCKHRRRCGWKMPHWRWMPQGSGF
jgi:Flagellar biosynthesis protein, FliO